MNKKVSKFLDDLSDALDKTSDAELFALVQKASIDDQIAGQYATLEIKVLGCPSYTGKGLEHISVDYLITSEYAEAA